MNMQKLLYVITQAPYSNSSGQEALDALLIGAAFEQDVSVLFLHNGVFQLKKQQDTRQTNSKTANIKQFTKTFNVLDDFGVENIYVDQLSLLSRGLNDEQLILPVNVLGSEQVKELVAQQFRVFTF